MRMICPNCGAQYEVDDKVIPDDGRDVQCSNCGHTWFQQPAHMDQGLADELNLELEESPQDEDQGDTPGAEPPIGKSGRERRGIDPHVADVLRQEAEREKAARSGNSPGLETQPDLGLGETNGHAADRSAAARARMARLRGADDASPEAAAAAASASRSDLLPDIEEINSSLRNSQDREEADGNASDQDQSHGRPKPRRNGFRMGFLLIVLISAIATGLYVFAPKIVKALPQAEPYLIEYVDAVNSLRNRANTGTEMAVSKLRALVASMTGG